MECDNVIIWFKFKNINHKNTFTLNFNFYNFFIMFQLFYVIVIDKNVILNQKIENSSPLLLISNKNNTYISKFPRKLFVSI